MLLGQSSLGDQLRQWRRVRRMSQLDLALEANMSSRHLSFVETGRSRPSREAILRLAESLDVPLRARNAMLVAAGLAPYFPEMGLDDPAMAPARLAIDRVLAAHFPFPALAVDRHWNLVAANRAVAPLLAGTARHLHAPPVNVLRLSLHPEGLAPAIVNLGEWKAHLIARLTEQHQVSADPHLLELREELRLYPAPEAPADPGGHGLFVPMVLEMDGRKLSFLSTTTMFGTPVEVTLSEIAIEAFLPADEETAAALHALAAAASGDQDE